MDGLRVRRPTVADAAAVAELVSAYDAGFGVDAETTAAEILEEWATVDLAHGAWLAVSATGETAGYVLVERERPGMLRADGYVHPSFAGRGLGTRLVELSEARGRELAALEGSGSRVLLHNTTLLADEAARALLERSGYRPVNWSYRMAVRLEEEPRRPDWPAGIGVRSLDPVHDLEAFHAAVSEAFAEHWGGPRTSEHLRVAVEQEDFDPTLWFLVLDGEEIAGTVECLQRGAGGHVRYLGVRERWRGRGLGRALLRHGFCELYQRGLRRVTLGVDANNASGAVRLYETEGMSVELAAVTFEKVLLPGREHASP